MSHQNTAYKTKNMSAQKKVKLTSQLFVLGKKLNKLNNKNEPKEKQAGR